VLHSDTVHCGGDDSNVSATAWRHHEVERVVLVLISAVLTLGAIELGRREVAAHRRTGQPWIRVDASAAGALFTALAAVGGWIVLIFDKQPAGGLAGLIAVLVVMFLLLTADDRLR
jgi:hypothetical protein